LHALVFHPADGLIAGMLQLESQGSLERQGGELRFLDLVNTSTSFAPRPAPSA
jgi:hypothetical protein